MHPRPSYDEKLLGILRASAGVFAEKGYHRASVRDISAATDVSLSGLYYYFRSKEELLFLIQDHCFGTLLDRVQARLRGVESPTDRLRLFVSNHLQFFLNNMEEMKVLSHESEVLTGEFKAQIAVKKRDYSETLSEILKELVSLPEPELRAATFGLFGMMNWIYTWHKPGRDLSEEALIEQTLQLFLNGFLRCRESTLEGELAAGELGGAPSIWRGA